MKKILATLAIISMCAYSCSTKFKVGAEYKDVTVVYGLLSVSDTAHYIKITKGYYDENLNNLELAKNPDSIYFNSLQVKVEILNNGTVIQTIPLDLVDLINEGYPKDPGTFSNAKNYAYKFKKTLDPSKTYRLLITNLTSGKSIKGETSVIDNSVTKFKFLKPNDNAEELVLADPINPYVFSWRGPSNAAFYDVVIRFKYQEVNLTTLDTAYIVKDIPVVKSISSVVGDQKATLSNVAFLKQLNSFISEAPLNIKRYIDTPDLFVLAGGQELKTYIDVNTAQGGITFDQIKPNYTNLKGENVFGILSTRGQISLQNIRFSGSTLDSIMLGSYNLNLRFVGISNK